MDAYRKAAVDAVIDGWYDDKFMIDVARRASIDGGKNPEQNLSDLASLFGVRFISGRERVKVALPKLSPTVNDMLWNGRKSEDVRAALGRRFGGRPAKGRIAISVRARDKRADWQTVK